MKLESMKHVMPLIKKCDVILRNGEKQFVGLYFNKSEYVPPIVLFKCDKEAVLIILTLSPWLQCIQNWTGSSIKMKVLMKH